MNKELPKGAVIGIVALAVIAISAAGYFFLGGGTMPGTVPETEKLKPEEAVERYQKYGGGTNAEAAARQATANQAPQ